LTQQLSDGQWWEDEFDLSALTYPQFLAFFFDRPIVGDENEYDLFRSGIDRFVASNPVAVVAHVRAICRNFSDLTKVYSHEQLDQACGRCSALASVANDFFSILQWISDCESIVSSPCTCRFGT
jgi:hypothetical protein